MGLSAPGHGWSKRDRQDRIRQGRGLRRWAEQKPLDLRQLEGEIADGFGAADVGGDRFDAVVGSLGMLAVVLGVHGEGVPHDGAVRGTEGWILALDKRAIQSYQPATPSNGADAPWLPEARGSFDV